MAVDDRSRVAYAELLPDERKGTVCGFMARVLAFFEGLEVPVERVMTDNGPVYRSRELNTLLASRGVKRRYTRPFSPQQNGLVERMSRTPAQEWQYARAWESKGPRAKALGPFIEHCNWDHPRNACGGLPDVAHRRRKQRRNTQQLAMRIQVEKPELAN